MPPSSRGLGHLPFTEVTGIRIPLGVLFIASSRFLCNAKLSSRLLTKIIQKDTKGYKSRTLIVKVSSRYFLYFIEDHPHLFRTYFQATQKLSLSL